MAETKKHSNHHLAIRLIAVFFLVCLVFLIFLGVWSIRQQVRLIIGEPDSNLSWSQITFYEVALFINQNRIQQPSPLNQETLFTIESGEPLDDIINGLEKQDVISDGALFRNILIYTGADRKILPGKYLIPVGSSLRDVTARLQDANSSMVDFVILPGWRKEEIAEALPTSGLNIPIGEFLSKANQPVNDPDVIDSESVSHEGFFSPGRYSFRRDISTGAFISTFLKRSRQILSQDMRDAFSSHGLTTYQAIILASIIQREAIIDSEKPMIASVFLNRLNLGMPLESDPTVQYSLGYTPDWGWWKSPLNLQDLQIDSTYNTYIISGLPPAPISNPDDASLQAVAFPEESTYLYFRAVCDNSGTHAFAKTLEEHSMNGCSDPGS